MDAKGKIMTSVLIVEDMQEIGESLSEFARIAGFDSLYTKNYSSLSSSQIKNATHIILDLNMPENDGLDVLDELKNSGIKTPIILCSGMPEDVVASAIDVIKELDLCFGGTLPKPFTYEQFKICISKASQTPPSARNLFQEQTKIRLTKGDLKIALQRGWFYPVFQPQIDVSDNSLMGVECLARLDHPLLGQYTPDTFITRLVETNLIDEFTTVFIRNTLIDLIKIGYPNDKRISFNIDPKSLNKALLFDLISLLSSQQIEPEQICLEITELSALGLTKELRTLLTKIRMNGFHISMDDFGTGFSTIHELDQLPFDEVKIDREFVSKIAERTGSLAIVKNIISLGNDLNMVVVAEGIETKEQAEILRQVNCKYMQGYFFSKPLKLDELALKFNDNKQLIESM